MCTLITFLNNKKLDLFERNHQIQLIIITLMLDSLYIVPIIIAFN
jgi:hypothetical protein